jgi:hypothetical protein
MTPLLDGQPSISWVKTFKTRVIIYTIIYHILPAEKHRPNVGKYSELLGNPQKKSGLIYGL